MPNDQTTAPSAISAPSSPVSSTPGGFHWSKPKLAVLTAVVAAAALGGWWYFSQYKKPLTQEELTRQQTIILASVDSNADKANKEFKPFIDYVASKSATLGIKEGKVLILASPADVSKKLREGKVDLYIDTLFSAFIIAKLSGSEPILNRWKNGEETYHSVIFTKVGSNVQTTDDLKGKRIVFQDRWSTSGYFLPKAELLARGYKMRLLASSKDAVSADEIGYYFTPDGSDATIFNDVAAGVAAAGGQNSTALNDSITAAKAAVADYPIILTTRNVFRQMVVARKDWDPKIKNGVKQIMLDMDKTPEGQAVLRDFRKTKKFTDFGPDPESVFTEIRKLTDLVENEIIGQL